MRRGFARVAVGVEMHRAVAMTMPVEMHAVAPQPPQHMRAQSYQHEADHGFDRLRHRFRNGAAEQDGGTRERKQGQRVAEPPGQSMFDDVADMGAARGDAGDGRDMIGLERVLHAEQKTKPQNSEHAALPA